MFPCFLGAVPLLVLAVLLRPLLLTALKELYQEEEASRKALGCLNQCGAASRTREDYEFERRGK